MRTKGQRVTPQTRTQFGPRAAKVKGCLLCNNINKNILSNRFFKSFKDHLASTICLHTKEMNIDKIFKWQRCEFTKRYFCHNCRLFFYPYIVLDSPVYFKYFICVFNLHVYCQLSFTVSSLLRSGLPHEYVNFSGHQIDVTMGFSGDLGQQSMILCFD